MISQNLHFRQNLHRYFVAGLATLFPITITAYLLIKIFQFSDGLLGHLLGRYLGFTIPGLGLVVTILILLGVGFISTRIAGRIVFPTLDIWLKRLPVAGTIYPAVKQLTQFLFPKEGQTSKITRVVLLEYPRPGLQTIGFVTGEMKIGGKTLLTILVPTPPSPFSGPIVFAEADQVTPLEMSMEEAVKLVVSGGLISPTQKKTGPGFLPSPPKT